MFLTKRSRQRWSRFKMFSHGGGEEVKSTVVNGLSWSDLYRGWWKIWSMGFRSTELLRFQISYNCLCSGLKLVIRIFALYHHIWVINGLRIGWNNEIKETIYLHHRWSFTRIRFQSFTMNMVVVRIRMSFLGSCTNHRVKGCNYTWKRRDIQILMVMLSGDLKEMNEEEDQSRDYDIIIHGRFSYMYRYKGNADEISFWHHITQYLLYFLGFHSHEFSLLVNFCYFFCCFFSMAQSNFLTKESVEKSLAAVTMKLRIKVPHFDNSALVQGYSKTLIGRCMNSRAQNINNLVFMLPRIWNLEERVVGADLGLGRSQFYFDREEDIAEVLKMEPFYFDHWMISLVRW